MTAAAAPLTSGQSVAFAKLPDQRRVLARRGRESGRAVSQIISCGIRSAARSCLSLARLALQVRPPANVGRGLEHAAPEEQAGLASGVAERPDVLIKCCRGGRTRTGRPLKRVI